ncbi:GAF domain-containing sensor histidine kinase [Streptomyces sp. NPDC059740]|uniref:sensor histidine kinase n=1 Tax=Streptomyces sp. NPDC059740 TaxID=3346926 RepID=UPI00364E2D60
MADSGADPDPGARLRGLLDELGGHFAGSAETWYGLRDRDLLQAVMSVGRDLETRRVLRYVVEAAVALVGARHGALGVIGEDGTPAESVTVGADADQAALIGHLPTGEGLPGGLIRSPEPLRLHDLADPPAYCGLPPHHPALRSFLAVPVRVRGTVFGNLYLTGKRDGTAFDERDELALQALAVAAGAAVDNAHLYERARRRQKWVEADAEITRMLLSGADRNGVMRRIVAFCRDILSADLGVLAQPAGEAADRLEIVVADGEAADRHQGLLVPVAGSVLGEAFTTEQAVSSADLEHDVRITAGPRRWAGLGAAVAVPMASGAVVRGVLLLARRRPRPAYTEPEIGSLRAFSRQAALVTEVADRRADAERVALMDERDRIARDLHDLAIQRLFATGMTLQSLLRYAEDPLTRERLTRAVDELDTTIKIIRSTIFGLREQQASGAATEGLRIRVARTVQEAVPHLGFTPAIRMEGLLDTDVPARTADHVVAVLAEALSNVARHAHAHRTDISLVAASDQLTLEVRDDGGGIPVGASGGGLGNLRSRAEELGGVLAVHSSEARGTTLVWRVPLTAGGAGR